MHSCHARHEHLRRHLPDLHDERHVRGRGNAREREVAVGIGRRRGRRSCRWTSSQVLHVFVPGMMGGSVPAGVVRNEDDDVVERDSSPPGSYTLPVSVVLFPPEHIET